MVSRGLSSVMRQLGGVLQHTKAGQTHFQLGSGRFSPLIRSTGRRLNAGSNLQPVAASLEDERTEEAPQSCSIVYSILEAAGHHYNSHLERPERVAATVRALKAAHLFDSPLVTELPAGSRRATPAEIALVHNYAQSVEKHSKKAAASGTIAIADIGDPDGATYITPTSFGDATLAVGSVLDLVDAVCSGKNSGGKSEKLGTPPAAFACVRPPGHHATPTTPLGFCIFNNVAIAAKYAQKEHGIGKVLILDIDVHNGNGTSEIFYRDPTVFIIDIFEPTVSYPAEFVPCSVTDVGLGPGKGYTANISMPKHAGHDSMIRILDEIVTPITYRFHPDLILVSAGYDAHHEDPLGLLQYRSSTYHCIATKLKKLAGELCGGRLVFVLEGGYAPQGLSEGVTETWRALLGMPSEEAKKQVELEYPEPEDQLEELIKRLKHVHGL